VEYLLDSVTARTMLSNSEFIVMNNQAASDRAELAKLLNISEQQLSYVTNRSRMKCPAAQRAGFAARKFRSEAGCGLMWIGNAIVPFVNRFPKGSLYNLMTTRPSEISDGFINSGKPII
jgi:hypothetical protein